MMGKSLWQANRTHQAIDPFDAALAATPHEEIRGGSMAGKACALVLLGRHEEAIEWSRRAQLEINAGRTAFLGEVCALGRMGRRKDAATAVERARQADPRLGSASVLHDCPLVDQTARRSIRDGLASAGLSMESVDHDPAD